MNKTVPLELNWLQKAYRSLCAFLHHLFQHHAPTEKEIDKSLKDTFPASDPPAH